MYCKQAKNLFIPYVCTFKTECVKISYTKKGNTIKAKDFSTTKSIRVYFSGNIKHFFRFFILILHIKKGEIPHSHVKVKLPGTRGEATSYLLLINKAKALLLPIENFKYFILLVLLI